MRNVQRLEAAWPAAARDDARPGVPGKQFWSERGGPGSSMLVALDLIDHDFPRAVLEVDDPKPLRSAIEQTLSQA